MDRVFVAAELLKVAKDLTAFEFPSQAALDAYMKDHPGADKSKHKVKEAPGQGSFDFKPMKKTPKTTPHVKKNIKKDSLSKVQNVLKTHEIEDDSDEMKEMAGFKKNLGQRVPEKDVGKYFVRNAQKLKADFIKNMDKSNYSSPEAFKAAQARIQKMPTGDFAKVLAAVVADDEEAA